MFFLRRVRPLAAAAAVLLLFLCAVSAQAQYAAPLARMGFGARGMALGNGLAADASGQASTYYNPALGPELTQQFLSGSVSLMSQDRRLEFIEFGTPIEPSAGVSAGLIHAAVSEIDGRDASGYHTEMLSTDEYLFFLAFGLRLTDRLQVGTSLQLFRADLYDGLSPEVSFGLDLGLLYELTPRVHLGFVADDLLGGYSWDTSDIYGQQGRVTSDAFPRRFRLGGSYATRDGRLLLLAEGEARFTTVDYRERRVVLFEGKPVSRLESEELTSASFLLRLGSEYRLSEQVRLRAGVDRIGDRDLGGATPRAGVQFRQQVGNLTLDVDYAAVLEPYASGLMHAVALHVYL